MGVCPQKYILIQSYKTEATLPYPITNTRWQQDKVTIYLEKFKSITRMRSTRTQITIVCLVRLEVFRKTVTSLEVSTYASLQVSRLSQGEANHRCVCSIHWHQSLFLKLKIKQRQRILLSYLARMKVLSQLGLPQQQCLFMNRTNHQTQNRPSQSHLPLLRMPFRKARGLSD